MGVLCDGNELHLWISWMLEDAYGEIYKLLNYQKLRSSLKNNPNDI
jgi:hypothetical protein